MDKHFIESHENQRWSGNLVEDSLRILDSLERKQSATESTIFSLEQEPLLLSPPQNENQFGIKNISMKEENIYQGYEMQNFEEGSEEEEEENIQQSESMGEKGQQKLNQPSNKKKKSDQDDEKKPPNKKGRGKSNKDKKNHATKNLLVNCKSYFADYIQDNYPGAEEDPFFQHFKNLTCVNRQDYENLFQYEKFHNVLQQMFNDRFLQRQFQLSRVSPAIRGIYLDKLRVFEKAFKQKRLPRIS